MNPVSRTRTAITVCLLAVLSPVVPATAAENVGRIFAATGSAVGGVVMLNVDAKNFVQLTTNTFGSNTLGADPQHKSDYASISNTGVIAFASNRTPGEGWRIFRMNADGSGVKQLTFRKDAAGGADDLVPVISPDGKRIAFASRRSGVAANNNAQDLFVMNSDGSGIRQVTASEADGRSDSFVRIAVWSPDSKRLAYRGTRLTSPPHQSTAIRDVLGFINPDGTDEVKELVNDCAGGAVVDWVADKVLYSYGGNVQGCSAARLLVRDMKSSASTSLTVEATPGFAPNPGAARLSPDARRVMYSFTAPSGSSAPTAVVTLGLDGSDRRQVFAPIVIGGTWLWWSKGSAIAKSAKLTIKPESVTIKRGSKPITLVPKLTDAKGNVIAKSGADWTWAPNTGCDATINAVGVLTVPATARVGVCTAVIANDGKTARLKITIK